MKFTFDDFKDVGYSDAIDSIDAFVLKANYLLTKRVDPIINSARELVNALEQANLQGDTERVSEAYAQLKATLGHYPKGEEK